MLNKYPEILGIAVEEKAIDGFKKDFNIYVTPIIVLYIEGKEFFRENIFVSISELNYKIDRYHKMIFY